MHVFSFTFLSLTHTGDLAMGSSSSSAVCAKCDFYSKSGGVKESPSTSSSVVVGNGNRRLYHGLRCQQHSGNGINSVSVEQASQLKSRARELEAQLERARHTIANLRLEKER